MSCTDSSLFDCIRSTCDRAESFQRVFEDASESIDDLIAAIAADSQAVKCVVNGAEGQTCTLPEGAVLPTLAEALARLNACQIAAVSGEQFTAAAGQTVFSLAATPANVWALEVALNGAICRDPADYILAGSTITFAQPLSADDAVYTRSFTV